MTIYFCLNDVSDNMRVPTSEVFSLDEAETILEKENMYAKEHQVTMDFVYSLLNDDYIPVTEFTATFPLENFSIFEHVVQQLDEFSKEEKEAFVPFLEEGFNRSIEVEKKVIDSQKKGSKTTKKGKKKVSVLNMIVPKKKPKEKNEEAKPSKKPTDSSNDNENDFGHKILTEFEQAFEKEDYQKVVYLFEGYKALLSSRSELIAVAYSYLRLKNIEQAKYLNQQVVYAKLTTDILEMERYNDLCLDYENELNELKKAPIENAEKIKEVIDRIVYCQQEMEAI